MARSLADHDGLDEAADDRHQPLIGLLATIVAGEEQQLADADLDIGRIKRVLQFGNLFLKILCRRSRVGQFQNQLLTRHFQVVQLVIQDGQARPAFCVPVVDLAHKALLCRLDRRKHSAVTASLREGARFISLTSWAIIFSEMRSKVWRQGCS